VDNCYNCGEPGHFAASCPLGVPAATRDEHLGRIAALVRRWQDGEISVDEKRRLITAENTVWRDAHTY
jgi:hypothetical protein